MEGKIRYGEMKAYKYRGSYLRITTSSGTTEREAHQLQLDKITMRITRNAAALQR